MRLASIARGRALQVRSVVPVIPASKWSIIPVLALSITALLLLAGCTDKDVVAPDNGGVPDGIVCPAELPYIEIVTPSADDGEMYPPKIAFTWRGVGDGMIARTRYLVTELEPGEDGISMLNNRPELFEDSWTRWETFDPAGRTILIGEDRPLVDDHIYLFAVQAIDSCGRRTREFSHAHNARQFTVETVYPVLSVMGIRLGSGSFIGADLRPPPIMVPPNAQLAFLWEASNTFSWFGPVEYRYGWDIQNLGDDDEWMYGWSPWARSSFSRYFFSGVHVFYVEARDDAGTITRARIEIEVIPFPMDRDLLWIDDVSLGDDPLPDHRLPGEAQHDSFWTEVCSRAPGFQPERDICPADELYGSSSDSDPLPLEELAHYRFVIWTYGYSRSNAWKSTVRFVPEPEPCPVPPDWPATWPVFRPNTLALYFAGGGSALTCGWGDYNNSALAATFPEAPLLPASIPDGMPGGPAGENAGRYSMGYDDYHVTVVDKIVGTMGDLPEGVVRSIDRDAFIFAYTESVSPTLPDKLELSEYVTAEGMFFDPRVRGFLFVEAYDPQYYMDYRQMASHDCFLPFYRMKARSTLSPLDNAAVAVITTWWSCEDPVWPVINANVHFGFPLWYINRGQVERIADYIFRLWGIM